MSKYYTDEIIEEVRIQNDIEHVVSEYVKLERKGRSLFGLCPFHKEKSASFSVVPSKQIFYCFGCGKGGNVIHFIMNIENLGYVDAIKLLAERARIQLPEGDNEEERERARIKQELIKLNTESARFFHDKLQHPQNQKVREYLRKRKLSESMVRKFGLGYSPNEWDALYKHLLGKGFGKELLEKSGLVIQNKNGGNIDRFRDRVMFPIFDIRGNVIAFGGRVLDDSKLKYMNSPETLLYHKGRQLYGLNFAKNSNEKRILIVEGYMDVISLHQCGIINTVASLGTALTESQGRLLKKYADEVIISYDADAAGQAATLRGLDILNDIGCSVKVLSIPQGKDPDEFVKMNGTEAFRKLMNDSLSLIEYKMKILKSEISIETTEGKIKFLTKAAVLLSKVENHVEREMYIKKLSKEHGIREESLMTEVMKNMRPKSSFKPAHVKKLDTKEMEHKKDREDDKLLYYEKMILSLLVVDNGAFKTVTKSLKASDFTGETNKQVAEIIYNRLESNKGIVSGELLSVLDGDTASIFTKIIQEECNFEDSDKAVLDIIKKIVLIKLNKRQQEIFLQLSHTENLEKETLERLKLELKNIILQKKNI